MLFVINHLCGQFYSGTVSVLVLFVHVIQNCLCSTVEGVQYPEGCSVLWGISSILRGVPSLHYFMLMLFVIGRICGQFYSRTVSFHLGIYQNKYEIGGGGDSKRLIEALVT